MHHQPQEEPSLRSPGGIKVVRDLNPKDTSHQAHYEPLMHHQPQEEPSLRSPGGIKVVRDLNPKDTSHQVHYEHLMHHQPQEEPSLRSSGGIKVDRDLNPKDTNKSINKSSELDFNSLHLDSTIVMVWWSTIDSKYELSVGRITKLEYDSSHHPVKYQCMWFDNIKKSNYYLKSKERDKTFYGTDSILYIFDKGTKYFKDTGKLRTEFRHGNNIKEAHRRFLQSIETDDIEIDVVEEECMEDEELITSQSDIKNIIYNEPSSYDKLFGVTFSEANGITEINFKRKQEKVSVPIDNREFNQSANLALWEKWHINLNHMKFGPMRRLAQGDYGVPKCIADVKHSEVRGKCVTCQIYDLKAQPHPSRSIMAKDPTIGTYSIDVKICTRPDWYGNTCLLQVVGLLSKVYLCYPMKDHKKPSIIWELTKLWNFLNGKLTEILSDCEFEAIRPWCAEHNITLETAEAYIETQRPHPESANYNIERKAALLLGVNNMSYRFWSDACVHICYMHGITPNPALDNKTPFEMCGKGSIDLRYLKPFGSFVVVLKRKRQKLWTYSKRSTIGILLGPVDYKPAGTFKVFYRDNKGKPRIIATRNLGKLIDNSISNEDITKIISSVDLERRKVMEIQRVQSKEEAFEASEIIELEYADNNSAVLLDDVNNTISSKSMADTNLEVIQDFVNGSNRNLAYFNLFKPKIPRFYKQIAYLKDKEQWYQAISEEQYKMVEVKKTFGPITFEEWDTFSPERQSEISSKTINTLWVFNLKWDGTYKARLVADGSKQLPLIDDTRHASVMKMVTLMLLIMIARFYGLNFRMFDICTAYLNAENTEEVYVPVPEGYDMPGVKLLRILQALYGMLNAAQDWNDELVYIMTVRLEFDKSEHDYSLFIHRKKLVLVSYHVDDGFIVGKDEDIKEQLKLLNDIVELTCNGKELGIHLGKRIQRESNGDISITQEEQINNFLQENNLPSDTGKVNLTPLHGNSKLVKGSTDNLDTFSNYHSKTGSLVWYANNVRYDCKYTSSLMSRFNSCYDETHIHQLKRTMAYLGGNANLGVRFRKPLFSDDIFKNLVLFVDSDHADCLDTRYSISGNVIGYLTGDKVQGKTLNEKSVMIDAIDIAIVNNKIVPLSGMSKRQGGVSDNTAEAEYYAASDGGKELKFIRMLLADMLRLDHSTMVPTRAYTDNAASLSFIKGINKPPGPRMKHIDIKIHRVRHDERNGVVDFRKVETLDNVSDLFTKVLGNELHWRHTYTLMDRIVQLDDSDQVSDKHTTYTK
jgi:hypothetical protein